MTETLSLNSTLHHTIIKHIIDNGYAPKIYDLANLLRMSEEDTTTALKTFKTITE